MSELLPCPFDGGIAIVEFDADGLSVIPPVEPRGSEGNRK